MSTIQTGAAPSQLESDERTAPQDQAAIVQMVGGSEQRLLQLAGKLRALALRQELPPHNTNVMEHRLLHTRGHEGHL